MSRVAKAVRKKVFLTVNGRPLDFRPQSPPTVRRVIEFLDKYPDDLLTSDQLGRKLNISGESMKDRGRKPEFEPYSEMVVWDHHVRRVWGNRAMIAELRRQLAEAHED